MPTAQHSDADKVSVEKIFAECASLLRESDKNRDQLIQFYLLVVAAYLAAIKAASFDQVLTMFLGLGIFLLGIVLTRSVTDYRLWHSRYSQTAKLLIALGQVRPTQYRDTEQRMRPLAYEDMGVIRDEQKRAAATRGLLCRLEYYIRWRATGTEFRRFQSSLIITALPLFIVLYLSLSIILKNSPYIMMSIIIVLILIYYFESVYYASVTVYNVTVVCPWAYWLLDGLDPEWSFKDQGPRAGSGSGPTSRLPH